MKIICLIVFLSFFLFSFSKKPSLWPEPQNIVYGDENFQIDSSSFDFKLEGSGSTSQILQDKVEFYKKLLFPFPIKKEFKKFSFNSLLSTVVINVKSADETLQLGVNENYTISITNQESIISSQTIYGAIRGLETFSQLIYFNYTSSTYWIKNGPLLIIDYPRFKWRGILIDTSRHYIPTESMKLMIEAMAFNKMNTLHWHATDAQSFPLFINKYPELSQKGAYFDGDYSYSNEEVNDIVSYAKSFGIRVVIEIDGPGHSASFGKGIPSMISNCPKFLDNINSISLNPTQNFTYQVLTDIWKEMSTLFIDNFIHFGGDEVYYECWKEDPQINQWMQEHNMTTTQLEEYYFTNMNIIKSTISKKTIFWESVYDLKNFDILKDSIVQLWTDITKAQEVINSGIQVINSFGWYLDRQVPGPDIHYEFLDTWKDFYSLEPFDYVSQNQEMFLGGEACSWSEQVNWSSISNRIWPRASAVAERLWSSRNVNDISDATLRLNDFSCRLINRGIPSAPLVPGACYIGKMH
ncbi:beta-hexosaminidase [Anaeramoeba ignava]|uniref:Beta-hexosaminidase n=1 Tax=Anaeramoeba ignava TaxID=1746090 RepID=A0A9Q0LC60_ANAIG|nr:beta-hexosaminidase [Anaeramoeba ignava]